MGSNARDAIPARGFPLLPSKLFAPPARPSLVPRPRLLDKLNAALSGRLTLLSAPAGFGKTTLLGAWIATSRRATAWLSLDGEDSDLPRFLTYLVAAVRTIATSIGTGVLGALQSPPPPTESLLTPLLDEIAAVPDDLVVAFDDYRCGRARQDGHRGQLPFGRMMAASILMAIPVTAVYMLAQRFMVEGLTVGSVKG